MKRSATPKNNIKWHDVTVSRESREKLNGHRSVCLWFTGLPGAGKSTLAHAVEAELHKMGCRTYVLDGDNVRHGLCADLGFSKEDRTENIRRIGEMVKLFLDAGVITITAFISPFNDDRKWVRRLLGDSDFIEIYCRCPVEICALRDVKGHYRRAKSGDIKEFTGISSPYEPPEKPDITLNTGIVPLNECIKTIMQVLLEKKVISSVSLF